jgi:protein tyrosine phosphatase (PTP) superfamily phosphohydrolase (DUF442 family)
MTRHLLLTLTAGTVLLGAGCRHRWCRDRYDDVPPSRLGSPVPSRGATIPPSNLPTTPPPSTLPAPDLPPTRDSLRFEQSPPPTVDLPAVPGQTAPPATGKPDREIILPEGAAPAPKAANPNGFLGEPLTGDRPPTNGSPADPLRSSTSERPANPASAPASGGTRPVNLTLIPDRSGLSAGRTPTEANLDWLRANGYRTVVQLHAPDADVSKLKADAERRGLSVVAIPVSPETLKEAFDKFSAVVADRAVRPAFVADADGVRAGPLWYLVFRTQDLVGDEVARVRAGSLGLTADGTPERTRFWQAAQEVLAKR